MTTPSALALLVLLAAGPKSEAKRLEHRASVAFTAGDAKTALAEALEAYRLDPQPAYILSIAKYQEALGHWNRAAAAYREYLNKLPEASNKDEVLQLIAKADSHSGEASGPTADVPAVALVAPAEAPPPLVSTEGQLVAAPTTPLTPAEPAVVASASAAPLTEGHSHVLALSLAGASVVAAAFAVVGYAEVASYNSYAGGLQPGAASYSTVQGKLQTAQTWNVLAIVFTVAAAAGATGAVLTW